MIASTPGRSKADNANSSELVMDALHGIFAAQLRHALSMHESWLADPATITMLRA
ncbi:hypothetical protein [Caballeronia sp. SL2Y3]|uniref:hypothetical protein n=1 Tax=Caballeronia sp. SL2Y3 TaxID=2878151 RepID=UPI001FD59B93|nr:hypothetical protein [Caballeronia sp. SL2Y3]